jgi:hypothetical protein
MFVFFIDHFFFKQQFSLRLECLKLIQNGLADFAPFEPEDMYIAAKFMDDSLAIFLEMRNAITQLGIHERRTCVAHKCCKSDVELFIMEYRCVSVFERRCGTQ